MELSGAEIDTLVALIERGPLRDGGLPSKVGRNELLAKGFAAEVVIDRDYYFYAATAKGLEWYLDRYKATNISDAITNRILATQLP